MYSIVYVNIIALRMAKTLWSFGRSECNWVKWVHLQGCNCDTFSFAPFSVNVIFKRREFAQREANSLPLRVDLILEELCCLGKQTGIHKLCFCTLIKNPMMMMMMMMCFPL